MNHSKQQPIAEKERAERRGAQREKARAEHPQQGKGLWVSPVPPIRISRRYSFDDNGGGYEGL